jgi:hypothetical protein
MRKARATAAIASLAAAGALVLPAVAGAERTNFVFVTGLSGADEVPGPGDPDGSGLAVIRIDTSDGQICYLLLVRRIDPATAAHIHVGDDETAGPVVQGLEAPSDGFSLACVDNDALAAAIVADPANYYVNVHNVPFPAGAVRGQLG